MSTCFFHIRKFYNKPKSLRNFIRNNKRIFNILKKNDAIHNTFLVNSDLFKYSQEKFLYDLFLQKEPICLKLFDKNDYLAILKHLIIFNDIIDDFFLNVMVTDNDIVIKNNRLGLLSKLYGLFNLVIKVEKLF